MKNINDFYNELSSKFDIGSFEPILDSKVHKIKEKNHTNSALWYWGTETSSGFIIVWGNFRTLEKGFFSNIEKNTLSSQEKADLQAQREIAEQEFKETQAKKIKEINNFYNSLTKSVPDDFSYLKAKKISSYSSIKFSLEKKAIVIPLKNIKGKLTAIQYIFENPLPSGTNKLIYGVLKGAFFKINGFNPSQVILVEGLATGYSLSKIVDHDIICTMTFNNFENVYNSLGKAYKKEDIFIGFDNDNNNNYLKVVQNLRLKTTNYFVSKRGDFNDLYNENSTEAKKYVKECLGLSIPASGDAIKKLPIQFISKDTYKNVIPDKINFDIFLQYIHYHEIFRINIFTKKIESKIDETWSYITSNQVKIWIIDNILRYPEVRQLFNTKNILDRLLLETVDNSGQSLLPKFNPVQEWISSKKWDKKKRFEKFTANFTIADEFENGKRTAHHYFKCLTLLYFLIQNIEGAFFPLDSKVGLRNSFVLVLAGDELLGKTEWVLSLAPPDFVSSLEFVGGDKDSLSAIAKNWIVELGEIDSMFEKSAPIKRYITSQIDTFRLPYDKYHTEQIRRTSLIGTTNHFDFLKNEGGNRRFVILKIVDFIEKWDLAEMQQLWAEVKERFVDKKVSRVWIKEFFEMNRENNFNYINIPPALVFLLEQFEWGASQQDWGYKSMRDIYNELTNNYSALVAKDFLGGANLTKLNAYCYELLKIKKVEYKRKKRDGINRTFLPPFKASGFRKGKESKEMFSLANDRYLPALSQKYEEILKL